VKVKEDATLSSCEAFSESDPGTDSLADDDKDEEVGGERSKLDANDDEEE
jgi:hypothetical protein